MRTPRAPRGLTLIECAIIIAILALVVSAAAPSFAAFIETRRIEGVARQLALDLRVARDEALRRRSGVRVSVHAGDWGSCWVVHTGAAGQCPCDAAGAAACAGEAVVLKAVHLPAEGRIAVRANASIRFDPLHGVATPAGTLKVVAASGRAVHQVVNIAGRVRSCTSTVDAPPVPGYRLC